MEKTNLTEILRTFSKDELASFSDFVASPYHNKNSNAARLNKVLLKYAPGFPAEKITKEKIWAQLFPGKRYNYGTMKNIIFSLSGLAMDFLEIENHRANTREMDVNLLEELKQRNLAQLFFKKLREAGTKAGKAEHDSRTPLYSYIREHAELNYLDYDHQLRNKKFDYTELNRSLVKFCFGTFFLENTNNLQNSLSMDVKIDETLYLTFTETYEKLNIRDAYTDTFYYAFLCARSPENEEYYYRFKESFFKNISGFSKNVQYKLACCLLNYCKNNNYRNKFKFDKEEFIYVKLIMEKKLYRHTGIGWLDRYLYVGAFVSACRAGEQQWGERFIEEYKNELKEDSRQQFYCYAHINKNIRLRRFEEALKYYSMCNDVKGRDKLNFRAFGFVIYYELGYFEELRSLAGATLRMINNDRLFYAEDKTLFRNFINTLVKMADYRTGSGKFKNDPGFADMITGYVDKNPVAMSQWTHSKIAEIRKSNKTA